MAIDFSKKVHFPNGATVLNGTPHKITFRLTTGEDVVVEPCGATLKAQANEVIAHQIGGITYVRTVFASSHEGEAEIREIDGANIGSSLVIVGSIISAQAYPGMVCAMTPAPGFERVPPAEKRMNPDKFTIF